ncbi:MAG TPA: VOC family protein, partial [Candidatus Polarisedimenticolia bacterium]|nr:VOC family protein [Candidatus Polarisedimenticolia bacterium]
MSEERAVYRSGAETGALDGVPARGISELILVVKSVARSVEFYRDVVGLLPDNLANPTFAWFWAGPKGVSQRIGITEKPLSFGAEHVKGPHHFAFGTERSRIPELKKALEAKGLEVEGPVEFKFWNALSIYFSDPDQN